MAPQAKPAYNSNILMTNNEERCDMNKMLDRYENDVSIFYSQIKYYLG